MSVPDPWPNELEDPGPPPLPDGDRSTAQYVIDGIAAALAPPWWHKAAACAGIGVELFFPDGKGKPPARLKRYAATAVSWMPV